MTSVKKITNCRGKYVLVRADFNVPIENGKVSDLFRITAALPTIKLLSKKGARVILLSHIGRDPEDSLEPVYKILRKHIALRFVRAVVGEAALAARDSMKNGDVILLENLRSEPGEKEGSREFAKALAALGDVYVNEAFPVSHRSDASIVQLPKLLPSYAGLQFESEVNHLSKALSPKHPFLFIQGGAKAETKLPLLRRFLKSADHVFIGGELANDFFKAQGYAIGTSAFDENTPNLKALLKNSRLIIPKTVVALEKNGTSTTVPVSAIRPDARVVDVGLADIEALRPLIAKAKLIVWNGPMGWYEGGYGKATEKLLQLLAQAKGETIIGGGDTAVLVDRKKMNDKFTFVSTGGGATLEFLSKGTLVGIKALA